MLVNIMIQMLIQTNYKGGQVEFDKDFETFITGGNRLVLAPKGDKVLPEEFKEKLNEMASGMNFVPVYAASINFKGFSKEEAEARFNDYMKESFSKSEGAFNGRLMLQANLALVDVIAPGISKGSKEGAELISIMTGLDLVTNIRIQFEDETFFQVPEEGSIPEPNKTSELVSDKPERDTVISEDDILNLKIAMGSAETIEDFLEMV